MSNNSYSKPIDALTDFPPLQVIYSINNESEHRKNSTLSQVHWKDHAHITKPSMWTNRLALNCMWVTTMKPWKEQKPVGCRLVENNLEDFLPWWQIQVLYKSLVKEFSYSYVKLKYLLAYLKDTDMILL